MDKHDNVETRASTGDLVETLDRVQYSIGQGPCVDTLRESGMEVVTAPNIRHDQPWPRYVPAAVDAGLPSQLDVKLYVDDEGTLGGINFYSTTSDEIDPDAEHIADLFAPTPRHRPSTTSPYARWARRASRTQGTATISTRPCRLERVVVRQSASSWSVTT